jgi:hypothetical protein
MNLKQIIPIDSDKGMFAGVPFVVQPNGVLARVVNTEVMPHVTINKSKLQSLKPVLDWIQADWGLNFSKTHDRKVAMRILRNSVIKN